MKRLLVLVLVVILVLSFTTFVSAAVIIGGNIRVWYLATDDANTNIYNSTFRFDRLALTVSSDLGKNNGIKGEIQMNGLGKQIDTRLDSGYYYQKGLFIQNDELDLGAFNSLPFKNGYSLALFKAGLGDALKISNSAGIQYSIANSAYEFALAVANAKTDVIANDAQAGIEGFNYGLRFSYKPVTGLKAGLGYAMAYTTNSQSYDTKMILDCSYNAAPFGVLVEYASVTPTTNNVSGDALTGAYVEGAYAMGAFTPYIGRAMNTGEKGDLMNSKVNVNVGGFGPGATGNKLLAIKDDWTVIGLKYQLPTGNQYLQGEYIKADQNQTNTKEQWALGIRLIATF